MSQTIAPAAEMAPAGKTIFGQPRGLATLFFTEMWERFTFYGMRAILILFMVASVSEGGLGIDDKTASSIYGLYLACTYLFSLLGGWVADRLIGAQRAVLGGAVLITLGNAMLASGNVSVFFLGLCVIVFGVGFLKPNASAVVAQLYPEGGARRDAGFSIFYMGINIGSLLGSLLVPICAHRFGWHYGFALPALGMFFGIVQFVTTRHYLGAAGRDIVSAQRGSWLPLIVLVGVLASIAVLTMTGVLVINPIVVSAAASWLIGLLGAGYFVYLIFFAGLTAQERSRVYVLLALAFGCVMFWAGYEQMGASFNLFAQRYTDRTFFGVEIAAGTLQAVNPALIILLAPVLAAVWLALGKRNRDLSPAAKFGVGLVLLGAGFFVMYLASHYVLAGQKVLPTWLILTYLLHTVGELCVSPVGLSSMTKLAPARFVGQAMGLWFVAEALGTNLAGQLSGEYDASHLESLPGLFLKLFWWGVVSGGIMLVLTPVLKRFMTGVR